MDELIRNKRTYRSSPTVRTAKVEISGELIDWGKDNGIDVVKEVEAAFRKFAEEEKS